MAGARAVVGRRKASALRSARAASDDAAQNLRLSALCIPLFFWRQKLRGFGLQSSDTDVSRERDRFSFRPRDSGGGGPLELAQRANRGGGGAGLRASMLVQNVLFARRSERAKNVWTSFKRLRSVESCAPSTTLLRRVVPLPRCAGAH